MTGQHNRQCEAIQLLCLNHKSMQLKINRTILCKRHTSFNWF